MIAAAEPIHNSDGCLPRGELARMGPHPTDWHRLLGIPCFPCAPQTLQSVVTWGVSAHWGAGPVPTGLGEPTPRRQHGRSWNIFLGKEKRCLLGSAAQQVDGDSARALAGSQTSPSSVLPQHSSHGCPPVHVPSLSPPGGKGPHSASGEFFKINTCF